VVWLCVEEDHRARCTRHVRVCVCVYVNVYTLCEHTHTLHISHPTATASFVLARYPRAIICH